MIVDRQMGKRRTVLAACALICWTRALAYVPRVRTTPVQEPIIAAAAGREWVLWCYIVAWTAVGGLCVWMMRTGRIILPVGLTSGLMAAWGTAWLIGWLQHPHTTWWQTAGTYLLPALALSALVTLTPRASESALEDADE